MITKKTHYSNKKSWDSKFRKEQRKIALYIIMHVLISAYIFEVLGFAEHDRRYLYNGYDIPLHKPAVPVVNK